MDLAEDCEEDFEAAEYSCRENAVTSDAHIEATCGVLANGGGTPRYFSLHFFSFFSFFLFFNSRRNELSRGGAMMGWMDMEGSGGVGGFVEWAFYAIPLRASSKQWVGSQCEVKITMVWPRDLRPRAASMTRRSAPPMPRSGWMKMIVFFLCSSS